MADRAQAEHLVGLPGVARERAAVLLADLLQQALAHEHLDGAVDALGEAVLVPGQEQLRLQERVQRAAQALQLRAAHAPVVLEAHRDPRRGGEQVQHVVAEVAEQHRGVVVDAEHVAERMRRAREHADLLAVGDDLLGRVRGDGDVFGIRHLAQQGLRQRDLRQQVGLAHRVLGRGQQRHRQQVDRVHVGGAVDVDLDALGEVVDGVREPRRLLVLGHRLAVPVRRVPREHVVERDALAEVHHDLPEILSQHLRHAPQQLPDRFLLLGLAGKLVAVAVAFHQLLVADVHRLEQHRARGLAQVAAQQHRDHPALGRQQAAGARAPALDEAFDGIAAGHQLRDVFAQYRRIQRAAADRAADEERAAAAQQAADHRQVEVDAGDDVRRHDALGVEQVRHQQVVHVAAVAGHVDDFVARRRFLQLLEVVHQHAAVDAVPHRREQGTGRAHHRVRIVRGDFPDVAVRLLPCVEQRGLVAARLFGDGFLHRIRGQHRVGEQPARGQVRADDRGADAVEVRAQHARELAHGAFGIESFSDDAAQVHRRGEAHGGVAAVEQDREQAAEAADQRPVFREQHAEPAAGLVRRAADEDRHRHQLHVQRRVRAVRLDQP